MRQPTPLFGFQALLVATWFLAGSPRAAAAGQVDELRAALQGVIDARRATQAARGGSLLLDGPMTIAPAAGGSYAVTLPGVELRGRNGDRVALGTVRLMARASATGRGWEIDATLPSPIRSYDRDGKPDAELSLGTQRIGGVLDSALKEFTTLHVAFGNVGHRSLTGQGRARIATVRYDLDLAPGAAGSWSGPAIGAVTGVSLTDPDNGTSLTLDSLTFETNCRDCTGAAARTLVLPALDSGWMSGQGGEGVPPVRREGLVDLVRQCRSLSGRTTLKELNLVSPRTRGSKERLRVSVREADFGGEVATTGADSLLEGALRTRMIGMRGLPEMETTGSPLVAEFFPQTTAFEASFRNVDPRRWNNAAAPDSASRISGAREALVAPGTVYELKEFSLGAPGWDARLAGVLTGVATAPLGILLDLTLVCSGVDESLERLHDLAAAPGLKPATEKELALVSQALGFIQMLGRQDVAPDGRSRRSFHLLVDGKGQVLLNGSDVKSLLEMVGGPKPGGR